MTSQAEQYLRKRCQYLELVIVQQGQELAQLQADLEFTESVGAAFAFDLARESEGTAFPRPMTALLKSWDEAIALLGQVPA